MSAARVLHVVTNLENGGAQTSVAKIVTGLRARGIDAHLAFSSTGGIRQGSHAALQAQLERDGVPLHDIPAMRRSPSPFDPIAYGQLLQVLRGLRPAVMHTHASKAGVLGRVAARRARVPYLTHSVRGWSWHGYTGARRAFYIHLERRLARHTDHFVAVSWAMIDGGLAHGVGTARDYSVIRSGIELARFIAPDRARGVVRRELGIPSHAPVVGTVTRFSAAKAPLDFIEVATRVVHHIPEARFIVVGDGELRDVVTRAIERAGLGSRIMLLGERSDVASLLGAMDVFVSTSRWEGMPRVVVEAAAARIPIVATDVGGTREIVDAASGVLCSPGAIDAIVSGILTLLSDSTRATRLADAAFTRVTPEFDLDRVVDHHVALYRRAGIV